MSNGFREMQSHISNHLTNPLTFLMHVGNISLIFFLYFLLKVIFLREGFITKHLADVVQGLGHK